MIELRFFRTDLLVVTLVLALGLGQVVANANAQSPAPPHAVEIDTPLAESLPQLQRHSAWQQDVRAGDLDARRGVFAFGNGRTFARLGLGERANTLQGLVGPDYLAGDPELFGTFDLELEDTAGTAVELTVGAVRRVRGAGFVVTEDRGLDFALRTLTFAPPGSTTIWRIVEVEANEPDRSRGAALRIRLRAGGGVGGAGALPDALVVRGSGPTALAGSAAETARFAVVRLGDADGERARTEVDAPAGTLLRTIELDAKGRWTGVLTMETRFGPPPAMPAGTAADEPAPQTIAQAKELAASTFAWFAAANLPEHTVYRTDHARLESLFEDWKVLFTMLRCAASERIVDLVAADRGISVRQNNGILLALLRYGMWEQAGAQLDALFAAVRRSGRVADRYAVDGGATSEPAGDAKFDWKDVEVAAAELPSWIILQHYWYWRASGDATRIAAHWPLLDVCLKRQQRSVDDLLPFVGDEPYLGGALYRFDRSEFGARPGLIACDPAHDRVPWSLASNVLFLLSTQAFGELALARERFLDPALAESAQGDDPYRRRMFKLMQNLERHYWLDEFGHFAPALSPIDRSPHLEPVANINLLPLFAGWTYPTGERSRDNLQNSLARLARPGYRIGTTGAVAQTTGDLQGMLLVALAERDCAHRLHVLDTVLELAGPAGVWPELFDANDRPAGTLLDLGTSGVNLDAIGFALSGVRHASVPAWDRRDIRLELRLPHGAERFAILGSRKDGRVLDIEFDLEQHLMSAEEIEAQAEKPPEKQRDPTVLHPQVHAIVTLRAGAPERGYYDVAMHAGETLFVRYLALERNSADQPDLTRIEERDYVKVEDAVFLPADGAGALEPRRRALSQAPEPAGEGPPQVAAPPAERTLVLTNRGRAARIYDDASSLLVDTGLPFDLTDLRVALFGDDDSRRFDELVLDWGYDAGMPRTFVDPLLWKSSAFGELRERFVAAGGQVFAPEFLPVTRSLDPSGAPAAVGSSTSNGGIPAEASSVQLDFELTADVATRAILRIGAAADLTVQLDGSPLGEHLAERGVASQPDTTSFAVELAPGRHTLALTRKQPVETDAASVGSPLWVRFTDPRGVPLAGIESSR